MEDHMRLPAAVLAFCVLISGPAAAGCHLVDCVEEVPVSKADLEPLTCETLWILRNSIFDQYGYCFKTKKAMDWFNNDDCKIDDAEALPISAIQKSNIEKIKAMESWKGC
jgi:YARHG domain